MSGEIKIIATRRHWFVETGWCDGGGIGYWDGTSESVEVPSKEAAEAMRDGWLASGKLVKTHWGEIRPTFDYGMFRIRCEDREIPFEQAAREITDAAMRAGYEMAAKEAREIGVFLRRFDLVLKDVKMMEGK